MPWIAEHGPTFAARTDVEHGVVLGRLRHGADPANHGTGTGRQQRVEEGEQEAQDQAAHHHELRLVGAALEGHVGLEAEKRGDGQEASGGADHRVQHRPALHRLVALENLLDHLHRLLAGEVASSRQRACTRTEAGALIVTWRLVCSQRRGDGWTGTHPYLHRRRQCAACPCCPRPAARGAAQRRFRGRAA